MAASLVGGEIAHYLNYDKRQAMVPVTCTMRQDDWALPSGARMHWFVGPWTIIRQAFLGVMLVHLKLKLATLSTRSGILSMPE